MRTLSVALRKFCHLSSSHANASQLIYTEYYLQKEHIPPTPICQGGLTVLHMCFSLYIPTPKSTFLTTCIVKKVHITVSISLYLHQLLLMLRSDNLFFYYLLLFEMLCHHLKILYNRQMLRTDRLTLTARDALTGLAKCHSCSLVVFELRRPLAIAIFVHIRII